MARERGLAERLRARVEGGSVAHTTFLDPADADALLRELRDAGALAEAWGGFPGARRRVVSLRPEQVPAAERALAAWFVAGARAAEGLRAALLRSGVAGDELGDAVLHTDGCSIIALASADPPAVVELEGAELDLEVVPVERVASGSVKRLVAVVPALRVDVLGARAFGVSRSWFAKGVAAGRVRLNGRTADKRTEAAPGDEVWAEGLGRFRLCGVAGSTRKGNQKVELEVERS